MGRRVVGAPEGLLLLVMAITMVAALYVAGVAAADGDAIVRSQWCWSKMKDVCRSQAVGGSSVKSLSFGRQTDRVRRDCGWTNWPTLHYCLNKLGKHAASKLQAPGPALPGSHLSPGPAASPEPDLSSP